MFSFRINMENSLGLVFGPVGLTLYLPSLCIWNRAVYSESDGRRDVGVGGIVVVGIAIVVHIAPIRGVTGIGREKPPVVAATNGFCRT